MALYINPDPTLASNTSDIAALSSTVAAQIAAISSILGSSDSVSSTGDSVQAKLRYLIANPSPIRSIQRGFFSTTTATTNVALTSVVTGKTLVLPTGISGLTTTANIADTIGRLTLTDSTTLTINRATNGSNGSFGWVAVEFY